MPFLVQFESFFIQPYLFRGGKLKEMIGASQLLESLITDIEDTFLRGLFGPDHGIEFLRQAGGVFIARVPDKDAYETFMALWPLYVRHRAPGLQFGWAGCEYDSHLGQALEKLRRQLNQQKNLPAAQLPGIAPIAQRYQRTGEAALPKKALGGRFDEPLSASALAKREAAQNQRDAFSQLLPEGDYRFPTCFNTPGEEACKDERAFPFISGANPEAGEHDIALIHADGNSIGQRIIELFKKLEKLDETAYQNTYRGFSTALKKATEEAVRDAVAHVIGQAGIEKGKPVPLRPLIVGGDDVTFIVRADLALPFVTRLLEAFGRHSKARLDGALKDPQLRRLFPDQLTMTAGVAFFKSNQPFSMGYQLCETLTDEAKKAGRAQDAEIPPSLVAFHQITQSLFDEADQQLANDCRTPSGMHLCQSIWAIDGRSGNIPSLKRLKTLYSAFDQVSAGEQKTATFSFLRKLATALHTDPHHAERMWKRWLKNNAQRAKAVENALENDWQVSASDWIRQENGTLPLADLLTLYRTQTRLDGI